ncbi:hypothetical protein PCANC_00830 [Puccinia coronata f. sp. avenae]|uniref:Uncharacterized protein n=1 Tax=Puccinia coronata f. sp. avenae TaxID=200324 RepID=A0A2N5W7G5_9BASI|nr:hypothetical protein PCANC_10317 [Puccinia coronata f. sp. avenae]PLW58186.1 hypothetical protein PCANC_00830 [Puccinia coronata f. sp. avenae]
MGTQATPGESQEGNVSANHSGIVGFPTAPDGTHFLTDRPESAGSSISAKIACPARPVYT